MQSPSPYQELTQVTNIFHDSGIIQFLPIPFLLVYFCLQLFEVVDSEKEDEKLYEGSHPVTNDNIVREFGDRHVFEQQLIQLQEQLVGVMIENQNLRMSIHNRSYVFKLKNGNKELQEYKKAVPQ